MPRLPSPGPAANGAAAAIGFTALLALRRLESGGTAWAAPAWVGTLGRDGGSWIPSGSGPVGGGCQQLGFAWHQVIVACRRRGREPDRPRQFHTDPRAKCHSQ